MTQQQHASPATHGGDTMTSTSTTTNEHLQAIHAECSGFVDGEPPDLEVIIQHAEALAARVEEREAQLRLIAPVVNAAIEMYLWEGSTDYPNGDPEVEKRRQAFYSAVHDLWDLHDDELDFLEGASAPDATERTHERV